MKIKDVQLSILRTELYETVISTQGTVDELPELVLRIKPASPPVPQTSVPIHRAESVSISPAKSRPGTRGNVVCFIPPATFLTSLGLIEAHSRTCRGSGAKRTSAAAFDLRPLRTELRNGTSARDRATLRVVCVPARGAEPPGCRPPRIVNGVGGRGIGSSDGSKSHLLGSLSGPLSPAPKPVPITPKHGDGGSYLFGSRHPSGSEAAGPVKRGTKGTSRSGVSGYPPFGGSASTSKLYDSLASEEPKGQSRRGTRARSSRPQGQGSNAYKTPMRVSRRLKRDNSEVLCHILRLRKRAG